MSTGEQSTTTGSPGPLVSDAPDLVSTDERTIVDLRGPGPFVSLGQYRYLAAQHPLPPQIHPNLVVLALPQRGAFDFTMDGAALEVHPGELICIPNGTEYQAGSVAQPRGELLWLLLRTDGSGDADGAIGEAVRILLDGDAPVRSVPERVTDLLNQALEEPGDDGELTRAWRRSLCSAAVLEVARAARTGTSQAPLHPGMRRAAAWVDEHITEPISVGQLIDASQMSSTHFYEHFVRAFGTSPKDYVLRAKLSHAETLLATTDESITQIAHSLGFSTSQHFGTAFRRYVGTTPSEYRRGLRSTS